MGFLNEDSFLDGSILVEKQTPKKKQKKYLIVEVDES